MQTYVLAVLVDLVIKDRGLWDVAEASLAKWGRGQISVVFALVVESSTAVASSP